MRAPASLLALLLAACSSSSATAPAAVDAAVDASLDHSADADAAAVDAPADAPTEVGGSHTVCAFNRECPASERCACDVATGCFCETGPRGTGVNGVDACASGNDCASSVCVEGPGGAYVCSGECTGNADCGGKLPLCSDIAFVGKICVRTP
jgi:hypothetical protein